MNTVNKKTKKQILILLKQHYSLRTIARECGVAINTVKRYKKLYYKD